MNMNVNQQGKKFNLSSKLQTNVRSIDLLLSHLVFVNPSSFFSVCLSDCIPWLVLGWQTDRQGEVAVAVETVLWMLGCFPIRSKKSLISNASM